MALSITQTAALGEILKPGMFIASMGYPDIIAPIDPPPGLEYRKDSDVICARHGLKSQPIPDAESFFALNGCKLDVYDIVRERGCEILLDLNEPTQAPRQYDIVLDVGTLEHCFNIAQAIINMATMVKGGGYIIHENPFCSGNHGFYNLNPTFYADFYTANGFEVLDCKLVNQAGEAWSVPTIRRFKAPSAELNVFAMMRRAITQPFVFPVQSKYAGLIPAARVLGDVPPTRRAIGE